MPVDDAPDVLNGAGWRRPLQQLHEEGNALVDIGLLLCAVRYSSPQRHDERLTGRGGDSSGVAGQGRNCGRSQRQGTQPRVLGRAHTPVTMSAV